MYGWGTHHSLLGVDSWRFGAAFVWVWMSVCSVFARFLSFTSVFIRLCKYWEEDYMRDLDALNICTVGGAVGHSARFVGV